MPQQPKRIPTAEKLATALEDAGAPQWMIANAREGRYDDYKSSLPFPIYQLAYDAHSCALFSIEDRAEAGEFDAQLWESEEWAKTLVGQQIFKDF
jgi:hypothetical protein